MEESNIQLSFRPNVLDYIVKVLMQRPFSEVAPILADIQQQVQQPVLPAAPTITGNGHDTSAKEMQQ